MSEVVEESRVRRPIIEPPRKHDHATGPAAHPAQSPISALHASVGNRRLSRVFSAPGAINRLMLQAMPASTAASALAQREGETTEDEEELMQAKHEAASLQREGEIPEEEEMMQAKHEPAGPVVGREGGEVGGDIADSIESERGGGSGLRSDVRGQMEGAFGVDFSGVRVHQDDHADSLAQSISARAFTTGSDIFLRRDEHDSNTTLMAHELAHVVQQSSGVQAASESGMNVGAANDPLELEADRAAELVSAGAGPARLENEA